MQGSCWDVGMEGGGLDRILEVLHGLLCKLLNAYRAFGAENRVELCI